LKAKNIFTIPLGFQSGFLNNTGNDFDRDLTWCFAGQVKSHRKRMIQTLTRITPHNVVLTHQWADPAGLSVENMAQLYRRSIFAPCPFGNRNPDSFRLMESLEQGCIPVVLYFIDHDYYRFVMGDHPFIIDRTWHGAARQMERLIADPQRLRAKQEYVSQWYREYKKNLALDIRDIMAGATHRDLRSTQFHHQDNVLSARTRYFYKLYFSQGIWARAFRAAIKMTA
jgi:hypothetical protein